MGGFVALGADFPHPNPSNETPYTIDLGDTFNNRIGSRFERQVGKNYDVLYPLDGTDTKQESNNQWNGAILAKHSIMIREFSVDAQKRSTYKLVQDQKGQFDPSRVQLIDFITKASPRCYPHKKYGRYKFPTVVINSDPTPAETAELDKYFKPEGTYSNRGFLTQWNNDKDFKLNLYKRIRSIAYIAWDKGYENIVLGALGCGAFAHDPRIISKVFYDVFVKEFRGVFK